jgi:hypothetical protein
LAESTGACLLDAMILKLLLSVVFLVKPSMFIAFTQWEIMSARGRLIRIGRQNSNPWINHWLHPHPLPNLAKISLVAVGRPFWIMRTGTSKVVDPKAWESQQKIRKRESCQSRFLDFFLSWLANFINIRIMYSSYTSRWYILANCVRRFLRVNLFD